jgi:hypothetical protein
MRTALANFFLAWALCLVVAGCASAVPAVAASARAVGSDSRFQLDFSVPRTEWTTADSITGEATLSYLGTGSVPVSGSEFILFEFENADGSIKMTPVSDLVCNHDELGAGKAITSAITKSAGWGPSDPNAAFFESFFASPQVRLPAGTWTITAVASFSQSVDCSPTNQTLLASVVIHVNG